MTSNNGPYMSLQNSLTQLFSNCELNYNCCLLTIGINTVAVIKDSEQSFKIFDAHSRDLHGIGSWFTGAMKHIVSMSIMEFLPIVLYYLHI